jgi:hypothetical protein
MGSHIELAADERSKGETWREPKTQIFSVEEGGGPVSERSTRSAASNIAASRNQQNSFLTSL